MKDMKTMHVCLAMMTIALVACSEGNSNKISKISLEDLEDLPVVAHQVEVNGEKLTVCELSLLEDTIDLPLSYWIEDLQTVKLDGRDEALVGQGPVCVSDNYILVGRANNVPCKLFRKDGSYVGNVGSIGQGPGEYTMVYDMQIDEKSKSIFLLPWNAKSIFVYDMDGKYLKDIPLNKKYGKMIVPKGKFKVDVEKNRVAVVLLPFDYLPVVAWVQDMEGNFIYEHAAKHLKLQPDFSNEVLSAKSVGDALDAHIFAFWTMKTDTLYHLNVDDGRMIPKFTIDFSGRNIAMHDYFEFPNYFVGTFAKPKQISENMYEAKDEVFYMVEKVTGKGTFFRIGNDYLDNAPITYMPWHCTGGYYTLNVEPSILMERIEKGLKCKNLSAERRKWLEDLLADMDEDDNNYILFGKLKTGK